MKNLFAVLFLFFAFSSVNYLTAQSKKSHNPTIDITFKKATLEAGTLIMLQTTETLNSSELTTGQLIQCKVMTSIYAENRLVVPTGALALGRVKKIQKGGYNSPDMVILEMTSVQAIDGQSVILNGTEQKLQGTYPRQGFVLEPGRIITANVMDDHRIRL